jgi:protein TonB
VSPSAAVATLALHALLIAVAVHAFSGKPSYQPPTPLTVELLPAPPPPLAPAASAEPAAPSAPPKKFRPPRPKATPAHKQRTLPATATQTAPAASETAAPVASAAPTQAPAAASTPAPPPAPAPARTSVSVASYAASNRRPVYPRMSRMNDEQGTVVLRVLVKEDGSAGAVELKASSGYPLLDDSALSTVRTWRFNPATVNDKPVAEWYQLSIPFKLQNN